MSTQPKEWWEEEFKLSPKALSWIKRQAEKEATHPGRVLSQLIEGYMELEDDMGEQNVARLLQTLVHGPKEVLEKLQVLQFETNDLNEKARATLDTLRLFIIQNHATRTLGPNGVPRYTISKTEKEAIYPELAEETEDVR